MASAGFLPSVASQNCSSSQALGVADGPTQLTTHALGAVLAVRKASPERTGGETIVPQESCSYALRYPAFGDSPLHYVESSHVSASSTGLLHQQSYFQGLLVGVPATESRACKCERASMTCVAVLSVKGAASLKREATSPTVNAYLYVRCFTSS